MDDRNKNGTFKKGRKVSKKIRIKMRDKHLGKVLSQETKEKIRKSTLGNTNCLGNKLSKKHRENLSKSVKGKYVKEKSWMWITDWDKLSYVSKHRRICNLYGKAILCENLDCKSKSKVYQWANLSGRYKESADDWAMLCCSCHILYDRGKIDIKW